MSVFKERGIIMDVDMKSESLLLGNPEAVEALADLKRESNRYFLIGLICHICIPGYHASGFMNALDDEKISLKEFFEIIHDVSTMKRYARFSLRSEWLCSLIDGQEEKIATLVRMYPC